LPVKQQRRTISAKARWDSPRRAKTTLQWFGPELVRRGLARNEPWVVEHADEAVAMFPNCKEAAVLAACHPLALDYLKQAPVLAVTVASELGTEWNINTLMTAAGSIRDFLDERPKLRKLMSLYDIPYPMRRLHSDSISRDAERVVRALRSVNTSTIAQSIPVQLVRHKAWVSLMNAWVQRMEVAFGNQVNFIDWALKHYTFAYPAAQWEHVADFAGMNRYRFNERWTFERALREADEWTRELNAAGVNDDYDYVGFTADYTPLPNEAYEVNDYIFVPLRTSQELRTEGQEMSHCVRSYAYAVFKGRSRIFSIRAKATDHRIATLELMPPATVSQLKGKCNGPVGKGVQEAVAKFITEVFNGTRSVQM